MRDVLPTLVERWRNGETVGLTTVVATYGSAPRQPGAATARLADGGVIGSVSGGCVEGAVYELAGDVVESGTAQTERYGIADDDAFAVGLTCGGTIDVFCEPVSRETWPDLDEIGAAVDARRPVAVATVTSSDQPDVPVGAHLTIAPERARGSLGEPELDRVVAQDARGLLDLGETSILRYGPQGLRTGDGIAVFVNSMAPSPRLIVFGAVDYAAALAHAGAALGYHVTVCDARPVFATPARFPAAHEVVVDWPHRYLRAEMAAGRIDSRTAICVLTHDPKFDVPALQAAFESPEGVYIGAMGSRRTHDDRMRRLREEGVTDAALARLHSPIGLDLGGRTPAETAVSIMAEIIAVRRGGTGVTLTNLTDHIHPGISRIQPDPTRVGG
ncbi:XdhC family protein [Gordonia sp. Z-3]|jgi:xanthine dehydrogenase accessory factor|uniref:XdhC family protein n=1 Tax=Gordonia sp. Z-3 TaxID=3115408 RepID=UPI002E2CA641|nr:XdhC family protein [Gordonia sp. Z-3]MED5799633.1 XdhC family protein [Gordonia sp. Z-3]